MRLFCNCCYILCWNLHYILQYFTLDPLNGDAAALYLHKPDEYKKKVKELVKKYATEEALKEQEGRASSSESSMSDFSEDEAADMEL